MAESLLNNEIANNSTINQQTTLQQLNAEYIPQNVPIRVLDSVLNGVLQAYENLQLQRD